MPVPICPARLVGAVGIGPKARLKARKLLISHNAKTAKTPRFAKARYTPGTRRCVRFLQRIVSSKSPLKGCALLLGACLGRGPSDSNSSFNSV